MVQTTLMKSVSFQDTQAKPPETDNGSDLASVSDISGSTLGSGDILDEKVSIPRDARSFVKLVISYLF